MEAILDAATRWHYRECVPCHFPLDFNTQLFVKRQYAVL